MPVDEFYRPWLKSDEARGLTLRAAENAIAAVGDVTALVDDEISAYLLGLSALGHAYFATLNNAVASGLLSADDAKAYARLYTSENEKSLKKMRS